MKYMLIFAVSLFAFSCFGNEKAPLSAPQFSLPAQNTYGLKLVKYTPQNPFRNSDFSWFTEKLRAEKLIIATGGILLAAGVPFLIVGLLNLLAPSVDVTESTKNVYYVFTGVGSGLIAAGTGVIITGGVLFGIKRKKLTVAFITPFDQTARLR